jgi:hypothetical protein
MCIQHGTIVIEEPEVGDLPLNWQRRNANKSTRGEDLN